jgi:hypothetical protein
MQLLIISKGLKEDLNDVKEGLGDADRTCHEPILPRSDKNLKVHLLYETSVLPDALPQGRWPLPTRQGSPGKGLTL